MIGGNYMPFIEQYLAQSLAALEAASPPAQLDVLTGSGYKVDVFPSPSQSGPVVVYIHGGYWQELDRSHSHFAGAALQQGGWGCVVVEYPLAPESGIATMIDVCAEAIRWTKQHLDPRRLVVNGSSAGAHLAACAAADANVTVDGLLLFSGVYDLEPLIATSVDTALQLTPDEARVLSPLHRTPALVPTFLSCGEHETPWFKDLNHTYADYLCTYDIDTQRHESLSRNHFDIVFDLCNPASQARRWLADR